MVSSASASFLAGGSFGPLPPLRDRETVQHPFHHSQGADVAACGMWDVADKGAGRGSRAWVSSPPPAGLMTSLPNERPSDDDDDNEVDAKKAMTTAMTCFPVA
jgi:hypothetical protein